MMNRRHRPTRHSQGFTLVELMVVVVIITATSALAIPSIVKQVRDRRTRQTAEELASVYRQARLRALGRGSAVLVRYTKTTGTYATMEAIIGGAAANCVQLPSASCTAANWSTGSSTSQLLNTWSPPAEISTDVYADIANGGQGVLNGAALGSGIASLDICFTPMGRTLVRLANANAFTSMTAVPAIRVYRGNDGTLRRQVLVPPNGLARTDVAGTTL